MFLDPFYVIFKSLNGWGLFDCGGTFNDCRVEVWPGLHQLASVPTLAHLSLKPTRTCTLRAVFPYCLSVTHGRSYRVISHTCVFIEHAP